MNTISSHPCLQHHTMLKEICAPLQSLGVNFFGYTALDDSGNAFCLGSKSSYAEQYLKRNHVKKDILVQPKSNKIKNEYDFWDFQALDDNQKDLYRMAAEFDQSHTLSITQHFNNLSHSFHFSGSVSDDGLNQRLLEKMDCLHLFIDSFKEKLASVKELAAVYQYATSVDKSNIIADRKANLVRENPLTINLNEVAEHTLNFKASDYLTDSERDTLRWLSMGKSAQMISEINKLSRKTIERNIASIKEKLGCYTLFQMGITVAEKSMSMFLPKASFN